MKQIYTHKTNQILKQTSTRNINPKPFSMLVQPQTKLDFLNIFIIRNKGKGPPGRTRSPGMAYCPTRDNQPLAFNPHHPERCPEFIEGFVEGSLPEPVEGKNQIENELQTHIKIKFLSQLNFTIMKKQMFILFMAFFAYNVTALAQTTMLPVGTITPKTASCTSGVGGTDSPLNPKPGKAYDYGVTIGNTTNLVGNQVTDYTWWATKNPNFVISTATITSSPDLGGMLTVGGGLLNAGANYGQTGGTATMSITWSPQILAGTQYQGASPTFVAVMTNGACSNNIQVFELDPQPAFTVDITNIGSASSTAETYGNTISSCVSQVESAVYNSGKLDINYGINTIYFEVVAANFVDTWTSTISVAGLATGETASVTIYKSWADAQGQTGGIETIGYATNGTEVASAVLGTTETDTTNGVSMWLGVTVAHNNYETISTSTIRVTVAGMDSTGEYDLANNCDPVTDVDTDDWAEQDITPRPQVIDSTNDPSYNTIAPDTFIQKN